MKISPQWLRLDPETNAIDYLAHTVVFLKEAHFDPMAWKWVVIGLFGALHGFAICALQGTNPDRVLKGDKLIGFDEAMGRCRNARFMTMTDDSRVLTLTSEQRDALRQLKAEHRDVFEHFQPHSRSSELHELPAIVMHLIPVVRFLALDTGNFVHLNGSQQRRVRSLLRQGATLAAETKLYREMRSNKDYMDSSRRSTRTPNRGDD